MRTSLLLVALAACAREPSVPNSNSFVLLELFTSQSCSSCPPADEDLNGIAARQREEGSREFVVSWHVDYWNTLGWRDPYSLAEASDRQYAYVDAIETRRYTPQAVVNGQQDFVAGNDLARYWAIQNWLDEPSPVAIALSPERPSADTARVTVAVSGAPEGTELLVVLLQSNIVTDVPSGENAGETLAHDNVVRSTAHVPPETEEVTLSIPDDVPDEDLSVAAIVQYTDHLEVIGAELAEFVE